MKSAISLFLFSSTATQREREGSSKNPTNLAERSFPSAASSTSGAQVMWSILWAEWNTASSVQLPLLQSRRRRRRKKKGRKKKERRKKKEEEGRQRKERRRKLFNE